MKNRCRYILALLALASISAFLFVSAYSQEDMVLVDRGVFGDPERPSALFAHDAHNETAEIEDCNECHHVYEEGQRLEDESSEDQRCTDCHELAGEGGRPGLMKAFHLNCKGCHVKEKKGPIMCGECHVH